jgi:hypothetical protein
VFTIVSLQTLRYLHINLDDKYLAYKYAQNLANGYGLCFNIGQRVEGFTSLLHVLLLTVFIKAGHLLDHSDRTLITITVIARIISFVSTFGTLSYLFFFIRRYFNFSFWTVAISLIVITLRPDFIFSSVNGLETGLFMFLFTGFNVHLLLSDRTGGGFHRYMYMLFGSLTVLCRADGFAYIAVIMFLWHFFHFVIDKPDIFSFIKRLFSSSFVIFLAVAFCFAFRIWYFHYFFPNTYYVKVYSPFNTIINFFSPSPYLVAGWKRFPIVFVNYILPCCGLVLAVSFCYGALLVFTKAFRAEKFFTNNKYWSLCGAYCDEFFSDKRIRIGLLLVTVSSLIFISYTMYIGGDWMPGYRMIMHYFSFPFMIVCSIIVDLLTRLTKIKDDLIIGFTFLFALSFFYISDLFRIDSALMRSTKVVCELDSEEKLPEKHAFHFFKNGMKNKKNFLMYRPMVNELKSRMKKGDCIAIYEIGCTSFQFGTDYRIIDLAFLNDEVLSHLKSGEGHYGLSLGFIYVPSNELRGPKDRYVLANNPKYIILDKITIITGAVSDHVFENRYEIVKDFPYNSNNAFVIYKRANE